MKIRTDFVTNSSSSSFIVAIKNDEARKPFVMALMAATDNIGETREGRVISTVKEFDTFIVDSWGSYIDYTDESGERQCRKATLEEMKEAADLPEWYDECRAAIANGFCIVEKSIGYSDEGLSSFLSALAKNDTENIKILYED